MIIGITGHARHGKDTVSEYLEEFFNSNKVRLDSFAFPMKFMISNMFGWDYDSVYNNKDEIDPEYGISPRQALQALGTEFAQYILPEKYPLYKKTTGRTIWVKRLLQNIRATDITIVTDVRFPHEVQALRESNQQVIIIKVVRPDWPVDNSHSSEAEIDSIHPNYTIINDGTLTDLKEKTYKLFEEIKPVLNISQKIYISGPMTGKENYNKEEFLSAQNELQKQNWEVITPFDVTEQPICPTVNLPMYKELLAKDITALVSCDAIYMLLEWEDSTGAKIEKYVAEELGLKVFYQ